MLSHYAALAVSALSFLFVLGFLLKTFTGGRHRKWASAVGLLASLAALGLSAAFAWPLLIPPTPAVTVTLSEEAPRASLGTLTGHYVLVVRGQLPPLARGATVEAPYRLSLSRGDHDVAHVEGVLEEHWARQRVGRKRASTVPVPIAHTERVHELPRLDAAADGGAPLRVTLESLAAAVDGPLEVALVPKPLRARPVSLALVVLVLLTAVSDAAADRPTDGAVAAAGIGAFALLLGEGPPSATFPSVVTLGMLAAVGGLVVGRLARVGLVRLLFRRAPSDGSVRERHGGQ